ncbi:MAG TPA: MaoC family dehydratase [Candidatus Dormibacteraeota bacterium]|jgi:acyl dehydratase
MRHFESLDDLNAAVGEELGVSDWHVVDQTQITAFAQATGDHQWIHTDVARAADGPFGQTIAHGFLTLALTPILVREVYAVGGVRMAINYGANRVRFPQPLGSGGSVRARVHLDSAEAVAGGLQVVTHVVVELAEREKPCCVADLVTRFLT